MIKYKTLLARMTQFLKTYVSLWEKSLGSSISRVITDKSVNLIDSECLEVRAPFWATACLVAGGLGWTREHQSAETVCRASDLWPGGFSWLVAGSALPGGLDQFFFFIHYDHLGCVLVMVLCYMYFPMENPNDVHIFLIYFSSIKLIFCTQ